MAQSQNPHQQQQQQMYQGASPAPGLAQPASQQQQQYRAPSPAHGQGSFGYAGSAASHGPPQPQHQTSVYGQGLQYGGYQGQPAQAPQPQQQQQQRAARTPSPQPGVAPQNAAPTGQWSTTGLPVLFCEYNRSLLFATIFKKGMQSSRQMHGEAVLTCTDVKALYDYQATSAAEFDFQAGDIIAVTSTPDDGWWSGELLDEARRSPGRTDFPSNL
jgi:hypothetical protein